MLDACFELSITQHVIETMPPLIFLISRLLTSGELKRSCLEMMLYILGLGSQPFVL